MPQPAIWRRQSANRLKDLLGKIPSTGLAGEALSSDCHVDDLVRSLSGLPKLPVDQVPYQEIFAVADVNIGRSKAAEKLRVLLVNMQDGWHPNDGLVDDLIRKLSGLSKRTLDQIPYQEIFAETDVNLVTTAQLCAIAPETDPNIILALTIPLNLAMAEFSISTPRQQAHFITQIVYESNYFNVLQEFTSGEEYEGRSDLGNTEIGDGVKFKGRGLIQLVGRGNYSEYSHALGIDLINEPERLIEPALACRSAALFWDKRQLNEYADWDDLIQIRANINGGYNGLDLQMSLLEAAERAIYSKQKTSIKANIDVSINVDHVVHGSIKGIKFDDLTSPAQVGLDSNISQVTRSDEPSQADSVSSVQNLIRYPNLDCPDKAILGQRFSLIIELLRDKPEDQPEPLYGVLSLQDTGTDELPEVEIVLSHSGYDIEGSNTQIMQVERDDDSSVRFVLIPRKLGQHKIKVQFYQNGKPIGKAVRNILVSEQAVTVEVPQPDQLTNLELKTTLTIPPQDLELYIELADDRRTLSFRLNSVKKEINHHHTKLGHMTLQGEPLEKMQSVYKEMNDLAKKLPVTPEDRAWAEHQLEAAGNKLWDELIPELLKQEYWKLKSRVKSVLITSEEPWIPWEMLKPYRYNDDGDQENDLFWCQQFAISRWLSGAGGMEDELDIKTSRSIAPIQVNLPSVKEEVAFLEQLSVLRSSVTPLSAFSNRVQVLDSLKNEDLSVLHFACHGMFDATSPNDSAIKLSDGLLRPSEIKVRFGGKRQRPLIFINACHGGRAEFSFTGLGGWAEQMVNARAGAFIGAMWEVNDKLALQFAKTFYTALLQDNKTIAESFRQAREEIRQLAPYNSTWLAYTLYADPEGRVKA